MFFNEVNHSRLSLKLRATSEEISSQLDIYISNFFWKFTHFKKPKSRRSRQVKYLRLAQKSGSSLLSSLVFLEICKMNFKSDFYTLKSERSTLSNMEGAESFQ